MASEGDCGVLMWIAPDEFEDFLRIAAEDVTIQTALAASVCLYLKVLFSS